jgi:hypothetical protein
MSFDIFGVMEVKETLKSSINQIKSINWDKNN